VAVEDCPPNYPVDHFWPEIVAAIKVLDRIHDLLPAEPGVLVVGELMSQFVRHVVFQVAIGLKIVIKLCAGKRVRQRDLDGFRIELLGEFDGAHYSLFGFAGQAYHEISVDGQTQFAAVFHECE